MAALVNMTRCKWCGSLTENKEYWAGKTLVIFCKICGGNKNNGRE